MDNKLKFSDRLKALLKTEARQEVDPYVFNEPEPLTAINSRNVKNQSSKNSKPSLNHKIVKNNRAKGKCTRQRVKPESGSVAASRIVNRDKESEVDVEGTGRGLELRFSNSIQRKQRHLENLLRLKPKRHRRDHMLLYYPRAGDEMSDSDSSGDETAVYQRHWFSVENTSGVNRSARLSQLRSHLRRRLAQLQKSRPESESQLQEKAQCLLEAAWRDPEATARALYDSPGSSKAVDSPLLVGTLCGVEGCCQISLPCTRHCSRHIMINGDQLLFEHCTAKFSDNTQCCIPVFDVAHELPLCPEHARKRDNYHRKAQESKPKKARKKPTSPTISRPKPKARPKKRKRPSCSRSETKNCGVIQDQNHYVNQIGTSDNHTKTLNNLNAPQGTSHSSGLNLGLGLGSLGLGTALKADLGDHEVFASLDPAEHDFGNVLNNLPADAFNDLFIESRNGEYEPSREEEEELERALEAVDKDVRNLERMGQSHGLLEPALLAQLMSDIAS
ncbi:INO80 complex subunit D [Neodiprion pinetum]|uniref:INO80 complex subunit D n=1 Tax=Neodiprion lecontei TaxID=441921 RepID=A0A6J0BCF0_NEOLC|nr:INO80 complex subunit D [Neodiprion lecontei]XP_046469120.1 INO80 complex subunit D [Neodiprion pinetum]XP_046469121.1 INO80 complex subunit D [Neodiprion pinetum]XP_046469123.1 INO80 complex subunit D [Neodiprion pinetum]XP_046469124.1 INO80 complex subunit D [Neodiprion pinetum]XP_046587705.1 INO80 complex subunit D [Neodiprion lecontei]XP_046587706.1 INO80 complex subunit D [Neodiprion lecontei]XP_046587707.1 INO80 complex subunit D [Neodiprion lecontei]